MITDKNGSTEATVYDGDDGNDATVAVGTTTTLSPGSDATVTNSGTPGAAVFNFGIPKGDKGDTGEAGAAAQGGCGGSIAGVCALSIALVGFGVALISKKHRQD